MLRKIIDRITRSFSNKIFAFYILCLILPLILVMQLFIYEIQSTLKEKERLYTNERIGYVNSQIERMFQDMDSIAMSLLMNNSLRENLQDNENAMPDYEWFSNLKSANNILSSMAAYANYRYRITVVSADGQVYQSEQGNQQNSMLSIRSPMIQSVVNSNQNTVIFNRKLEGFDDVSVITLGKALYDNQRLSGVVLVEVPISELAFFINPLSSPDTSLYILENVHRIIYSSGENETAELDSSVVSAVSGRWETVDSAGQTYLIQHRDTKRANISILVMVTTSSLYKDSSLIILRFFVIFFAIIFITLLGLIVLTKFLTRNLNTLSRAVADYGAAPEHSISLSINTRDEVGQLAQGVLSMSGQITGLLHQIRESERSKRILYFQSLQAQINPHMIYNTLNTITYLAQLQGVENIQEVSSSFAALLHSVSSTNGEFITAADEIVYLKAYISIKKYNFLCDINLTFNLPEHAESCLILKLLLQPIVENSLIHGFQNRLEPGNIHIRFSLREQMLVIDVTDNGNGCSAETIQNILSGKAISHNTFLRVGIHNIRERMQLQYGDSCIFSMTSIPGEGTRVHIELPAQYEKSQER